MPRQRILYLGNGAHNPCLDLKASLQAHGFELLECPHSVSHNPECGHTIQSHHPVVVLIGPIPGATDAAVHLASTLRKVDQHLPIILLVTQSSEEQAIAAFRAGVTDYLTPPISSREVLASIQRCLVTARPTPLTTNGFPLNGTGAQQRPCLIGATPAMEKLRLSIERTAQTDATVLITGETGTGKELVADLVHHSSPRRDQPLVSINCAAIPDPLLESELFGYQRGAFTGADTTYEGKLLLANGGTIFLDEIGDMSLQAQAKILRALESKHVFRLGGKRAHPLNIRIIAATNQDLDRMIIAGTFRKDLYYRLNVTRIHVPPLRERTADIPRLIEYYVRFFNSKYGLTVQGVSKEALEACLAYDWQGNVRQLKNIIEQVIITHTSETITAADLSDRIGGGYTALRMDERPLSEEQARILAVLQATHWNISLAAQQLHWSRMTLYRKMEKFHIQKKGHLAASTNRQDCPLTESVTEAPFM